MQTLNRVLAVLLVAALAFSPATLSQGQSSMAAAIMDQAQEKPADKAKEEKKDEKKRTLPLKPERKIEFTTDEATWLSLDVTPDGKSIIFELLGDLYSLPIEGGEAKRLAVSDTAHKDGDTLGFDSQPSVSPDGKWIAFISDRDGNENLWICKIDGTEPKQLTRDNRIAFRSPTWMPDSNYVVVTKLQQGSNFWMYHIKGGSGLNMTAAPAAPAAPGGPGAGGPPRQGGTVSPDGKYIYFAQRPANVGGGYNQMNFGWQVARRDMKSGDVDIITQGDGAGFRPVVSPDSKWLVYGTRYEAQTGLRIRNLDSGADRWLKYPVQRDDMESGGSRDLFPGYSFTPDGREIVVTYDGKINRVNVETGAARVVPFTAKVQQELGPLARFQRRIETGAVRSRLIHDPVQSPDGKQIAFSAFTRLYVMDLAPGSKPRRVVSGDGTEYKPTWSPDGQWLAYVSWDSSGIGHIHKTRASGSGQPQRLTNVSAFYTDPAFSGDGTRVVARRGNAWMRAQTESEFGGLRVALDLVWLPSGGGDATLIVPARGLGAPHFGPEADRVYFYSGGNGLLSMRYDGTDRRTHLRVTGRPAPGQPQAPPAAEAQISPDGNYALARLSTNGGNYLFVTVIPRVGGEAPSINLYGGSVPVVQLADIGAESLGWSADGKMVTWSIGSTFFRRPLDSIQWEPPKPPTPPEKKDEAKPAEGAATEKKDEAKKEEPKKEEPKKEDKKPKEMDKGVESFEVALEFPRHIPQGTVVLRGATVITMKGDEVIRDADLVVKNNRIEAVGPRGKVTVPAGAKVMDMKGMTITPGFVDTHAHYEMRTEGVLETPNWSYLANMAYGVTSGLDVQTATNDYLMYTDMVEAGLMMGPRSYSTGPGVFGGTDFQNAEAAKYTLEKYKKYYRNHNIKSYVAGNRKQRQWVIQAAKELELTVTTEGALDLKLDLTHAIDGMGGNEHSLPIVPLYKDVVELFAQSKTSYTPTLLVLYGGPWAENFYYETTEVHDDAKLNRFTPHNSIDEKTKRRPWFRRDEHSFEKTAAQATKIQRAGGLIGVGAHGQLQGLGYHWELWSLASGGMTPREVLKAATIDGAEIIGLKQDVGSIEPGKMADLVIMSKNPLDDIKNTNTIKWVMINGELFEGETLNQVYPTEKKLPVNFWWWKDETKKQ